MILKTEKRKFHLHRSFIVIGNLDIDKIANKVSFGKKDFKYFIGYNDPEKVRRLCIFFPKWMHIEEILIKLNVYFLDKRWKIVRNI